MSGNEVSKYNYFSNLFTFGGCQKEVFFVSETTTKFRNGEQAIIRMTIPWKFWIFQMLVYSHMFIHFSSQWVLEK